MVDRPSIAPGEIPRRSNSIFMVLIGTCAILTIICACLISTIILIKQYQNNEKKNKNNYSSDNQYSSDIKILNMTKGWEKDHRIPESTKPLYYDLLLNPDLESGKFKGNVVISFQVTEPVEYLVIHVRNLEVTKTVLKKKVGETESDVKFKNAFHYEENQFWVVELNENEKLDSGLYNISLDFHGNLTGKIVGFYRSIYNVSNTTSRYIATSKFEPVDARQAYPCFDEPALKAKFKIKLVIPKEGYFALSNMNVEKEVGGPQPNQITVHFAETVPMSTYLTCFIISDFGHLGEESVENTEGHEPFPIKVYSRPNQINNTLFAKKVAAEVTKYFIKYFDIPYPLPKLDLIAIPDFVSGAMEHWGLITFRETALLFNETENSAAAKKRVALVVAHEIAHQWFGNLVTMKWWDDLWLNEGFASFMTFKGAAEGIEESKSWEIWSQAIYDDLQGVLYKDASIASHPIVRPVYHPSHITESFDSISYHKGQAVLRMLESFLGPETFKNGIRKYLKAYEYSSAATKDLWQWLTNEAHQTGIDVAQIMDTWTLQMGFPVVNVQREDNELILTQKRFLSDANSTFNPKESPFGYKWDIPIHYITSNDSKPKLIWLRRSDESVKIPINPNTTFVKLNYQQIGFYRVNYDKRDWDLFSNIFRTNHQVLDKIDRAQLIDDAFALASAKQLDYESVLDMVQYLKNETDYLPQVTALKQLKTILRLLITSVHYSNMRKFIRSLIEHKYGNDENQFSWEVSPSDSHIKRLLRTGILAAACHTGVEECLKDAGKLFMEWIKSPDKYIHPDLRALVYRVGMYSIAGEKEWDVVWERYKAETNVQQKISLLESLCHVKEPWLLTRLLEYAKEESNVRAQDYFFVLGQISANPVGQPIVWQFFRNEWLNLVDRFSITSRQLGLSISTITTEFSTQLQLEEIEAFCKKYPEAGAGEAARKGAVENVKRNIAWLDSNEKVIGDWLKKFLGESKG